MKKYLVTIDGANDKPATLHIVKAINGASACRIVIKKGYRAIDAREVSEEEILNNNYPSHTLEDISDRIPKISSKSVSQENETNSFLQTLSAEPLPTPPSNEGNLPPSHGSKHASSTDIRAGSKMRLVGASLLFMGFLAALAGSIWPTTIEFSTTVFSTTAIESKVIDIGLLHDRLIIVIFSAILNLCGCFALCIGIATGEIVESIRHAS